MENETKTIETGSTWDTFGDDAESARIRMTEAFKAWALAKRAATERTVYQKQSRVHDVAPFAQKALDDAAGPGSVPIVVVEFASIALDLIKQQAKLDLLNAWHRANCECDSDGDLNLLYAPSARQLWEWYCSEQEEQASQ